MTRSSLKSYFNFNSIQKNGLLLLIILIIIFQLFLFFYSCKQETVAKENPNEKEWLALQNEIDSNKNVKKRNKAVINPFNPNFISDYKGYVLGMSVQEIDRLHKYRALDKYVNSAKEFQAITKVSDSLLNTMTPYFKFPNWTTKNNNFTSFKKSVKPKEDKIIVKDINAATQEDLMKIYGIGQALSQRILNEKAKLGSFVNMKQIEDIWGLSPEVVKQIYQNFAIIEIPNVNKIDINTASVKELSHFYYFNYSLAKAIVTHRSMHGDFNNIEDLAKIKGFPVEKSNIIDLYLRFK